MSLPVIVDKQVTC